MKTASPRRLIKPANPQFSFGLWGRCKNSGRETAKQSGKAEGLAEWKMQCAKMDVALGGMISNLPLVSWRLPDVGAFFACTHTAAVEPELDFDFLSVLTCPGHPSSWRSSYAPASPARPGWWSTAAGGRGSRAGDAPPGWRPCPAKPHKQSKLSINFYCHEILRVSVRAPSKWAGLSAKSCQNVELILIVTYTKGITVNYSYE